MLMMKLNLMWRSVRNLLILLASIAYARIGCMIFGHASVFDEKECEVKPNLQYFSVVHKATREAHMCCKCGAVYGRSLPEEKDPAKGAKWRDVL